MPATAFPTIGGLQFRSGPATGIRNHVPQENDEAGHLIAQLRPPSPHHGEQITQITSRIGQVTSAQMTHITIEIRLRGTRRSVARFCFSCGDGKGSVSQLMVDEWIVSVPHRL